MFHLHATFVKVTSKLCNIGYRHSIQPGYLTAQFRGNRTSKIFGEYANKLASITVNINLLHSKLFRFTDD
jgi:hypothetical protein